MILKKDNKTNMDVWINSFGGCASNFLSHKLENVGLKTRTNEWKNEYCHYPYPKDLGIPIIYLYRDMRHSLLSQEKRKFAELNYRKLTMTNFVTAIDFEPIKLLGSMFHQFMNFVHCEDKNLLILHKNELFTEEGIKALNNHLGTTFDVFKEEKPLYDEKEKDQDYLDWLEYRPEFKKFKTEIHFVNNYRKRAPL
jgi:hypothetical protein